VPLKLIAEAISWQVGVPAKSLTPEEAEAHSGGFTVWVAGNGPASSERTKPVLGWESREVGLTSAIERPDFPTDRLFGSAFPEARPVNHCFQN